VRVEVFVAEPELAVLRAFVGGPEGAGVAEVEKAGGDGARRPV